MANRVGLTLALALLVSLAVAQDAKKGLHDVCVDDQECPLNAECTVTAKSVIEPVPKNCVCKKEFREFAAGTRCVGAGRECSVDKDCAADVNTTCMEDRVDHKKRCLCGSGNAVGVLDHCTKAALFLPCGSNEECPVNANCVAPGDAKGKVCSCLKNFKPKANITCEPSSAGRAAMLSAAMLFIYVSLTTIL
ncbi:uncharacterized protein [Anabrus simplex]|uniref:uncharacterized protein n=1 Tax=Anabrus simplex TaxID=316456 RepID=UPI0035A2A466